MSEVQDHRQFAALCRRAAGIPTQRGHLTETFSWPPRTNLNARRRNQRWSRRRRLRSIHSLPMAEFRPISQKSRHQQEEAIDAPHQMPVRRDR